MSTEVQAAAADQPPAPSAWPPEDVGTAQAVYRLAMMRMQYPELGRAEAVAKLALAAAITAWDEAEAASDPGRHTLFEQAAVESAKDAYAQALANLLRGAE